MSLVKDTSSGTATATTTATTTGSETPPSIAARDSPQATTASIASSTTKPSSSTTSNAMINDNDHPPDRTLWLGDLEPWMDDHYMVQVCSLFGWDTSAIHIPRPPAAPNATRHPNNAGYCLLVFSSHEKASGVMDVYGPSANANNANAQPILLPNSNRAIKLDWLSSASARSAIGRDPTPVDSAIEYSIFVGDIAADVTNADLMNVFRNPNLGLRGDFPPRLIAPFLSCCNAKVMVDSVTGISKGYGFVRFTSEADQKRALLEMQGLYCKSRPMRLSTATAKNKNPAADEEHVEAHNTNNIPVVVRVTPSTLSPTGSQPSGPVSPKSIDPARIRSITSAVAESAAPTSAPSSASSTSQRVTGEHQAGMFAKIAQLSNTLGQHYPAYRGGPVLPPPGMSNAQIQQWLIANPHAKAQLETILGGSIGPLTGDLNGNPGPVEHKPNVPPSDPLNTTVFVGGLSPLISEETLRTFFAPFGAIHYVKVPPGKSCGFVQYVRKSDAERAIEALGGFSIGGSKVRLSWGRIPAAQGAAQAAAAAAAAASANNVHASRTIAPPQSNPGDGPLSSEQAAAIIEKLVPALMAAAHHNHNGAVGPISPSSNNNTGLPLGMRSVVNQQQILPPRASAAPQGFRDAYGYPSPGPLTGQSPGPGYMHSNVNANPYGPTHGHPHAHAHAHGPHPNRLDYARNDYYYDPVPSSAGYSPAYSYMNVNMGGQGQGGAGAYGGGSASVLEDQLIGTYGGGIHRLQSSSLRQGPSPGNYGAGSAGGYMGGGGLGAVGGYGSEYDLDLGGFRSAGSFSGPPSAGIGATGGGGLYGGGGAFAGGMYGGGGGDMGGMSDRFGSRAGPFGGSSSASGMNGFGPVGGGGSGLNGFGSAGHGHGHSHGGHGHGGSSPYDYTGDASPQFQATDILRQDSTGLSYLSNNTSPGSATSGAHGKSAGGTGTTPSKVNGHGHGAPGSRIGDVDGGMRDLASRFGSLGVGSGAGTGAGGAGSSATSGTNSGVGSKGPLSPTGSSGVSGGFASQQHFRGDSGRYN